ncbi:MAG: hypothetical protein WAU57_18285 [Xanthobacteraceae bacterium]
MAIQNAASIRALKGFTDASVRQGRVHSFSVSRTRLLRRFITEINALVANGRVIVEVDGAVVRVRGGAPEKWRAAADRSRGDEAFLGANKPRR